MVRFGIKSIVADVAVVIVIFVLVFVVVVIVFAVFLFDVGMKRDKA